MKTLSIVLLWLGFFSFSFAQTKAALNTEEKCPTEQELRRQLLAFPEVSLMPQLSLMKECADSCDDAVARRLALRELAKQGTELAKQAETIKEKSKDRLDGF